MAPLANELRRRMGQFVSRLYKQRRQQGELYAAIHGQLRVEYTFALLILFLFLFFSVRREKVPAEESGRPEDSVVGRAGASLRALSGESQPGGSKFAIGSSLSL